MKVICSYHDVCHKCPHSELHEEGDGCCEEECVPYPASMCLIPDVIQVKDEQPA